MHYLRESEMRDLKQIYICHGCNMPPSCIEGEVGLDQEHEEQRGDLDRVLNQGGQDRINHLLFSPENSLKCRKQTLYLYSQPKVRLCMSSAHPAKTHTSSIFSISRYNADFVWSRDNGGE